RRLEPSAPRFRSSSPMGQGSDTKKGTSKLMILVPLFDLTFLNELGSQVVQVVWELQIGDTSQSIFAIPARDDVLAKRKPCNGAHACCSMSSRPAFSASSKGSPSSCRCRRPGTCC